MGVSKEECLRVLVVWERRERVRLLRRQSEVFFLFFFFSLRLTRWGCPVIAQIDSPPQILCGLEIFSFLLLSFLFFLFWYSHTNWMYPVSTRLHVHVSTFNSSPPPNPPHSLNYSPHLFLITFSFLYFHFFFSFILYFIFHISFVHINNS